MSALDKVKETKTFLEECVIELQKVTWPDWDQLRGSTIVVILFTIAISFVIWAMDSVASWTIGMVMGVFGA